jgi:DNA end-binding protein Ku
MAARSIGSFVLTFGLVAIPVKLYTATSAEKVSFNFLHKDCGSRLKQQTLCPVHEDLVERADTVRGFEYAKDQYVVFTDDELKALEAERDDSLELMQFVPASTVDHLLIEGSKYLGPDKGADRAYRLLSLAMLDQRCVGVGRWRTKSKDTLVIVRPFADGGLAMHQLFYGNEVRDFAEIERGKQVIVLHTSELNLARKLIDHLTRPALDVSQFEDGWSKKILAAVEAKVAGEEIVVPPAAPVAERFDLLEALRLSVVGAVAAESVITTAAKAKGPKKAAPRGKAAASRSRRVG